MKVRGKYILLVILAVIFLSCKKSFKPTVVNSNLNYLVVEGHISNGDSTIIKLSRTTNISSNVINKVETRANVTIEDTNHSLLTLTEKSPGTYFLIPFGLNSTQKYRLHIKTSDNKDYVSDYMPVKDAPLIDSITYQIQDTTLKINVNTHDSQNNTHYYRWEYVETWQFTSGYFSYYVSNGKQVVPRDVVNEQVYTCWGNNNAKDISVGSSVRLSQDVISQNTLIKLNQSSEKIYIKYSILVKQYALTSDEYTYWQTLKKNTETLGSIFDAQPSEEKGNLHCTTNPEELVIGYIGVGNATTKRIFISKSQLPASWQPNAKGCKVDSALFFNPRTGENDVNLIFNQPNPKYIPFQAIVGLGTGVIGYYDSTAECVDCRLTGNSVNKKPSFWQ